MFVFLGADVVKANEVTRPKQSPNITVAIYTSSGAT